MASVSELMREGMAIKTRMDADRKRLQEINAALAGLAEYREGSQTGHLYDSNLHVKVQRKTNVKWDQTGLNQARAGMGDELFFQVFKWEFKPSSKKALDGLLEFGKAEHRQMVLAAMTETPGAPSVEYELLVEVA